MLEYLWNGSAGGIAKPSEIDVVGHRIVHGGQDLRSHIGSMLAALGGLDPLIFTAGIGENSAAVGDAACEAFAFLGMKLDPGRNAQSPIDLHIAASDSAVRVLIVRAQENWAIKTTPSNNLYKHLDVTLVLDSLAVEPREGLIYRLYHRPAGIDRKYRSPMTKGMAPNVFFSLGKFHRWHCTICGRSGGAQ